ncbi:unnamed protein product [Rhizophagus irregularis]|nr:unnamed protein product [Rhizophagus irregularis]
MLSLIIPLVLVNILLNQLNMVKILLFTVQRNGFGGHGATIGGYILNDANVGAAFIDALQITTCKSFGICERRNNSRDASTHQQLTDERTIICRSK